MTGALDTSSSGQKDEKKDNDDSDDDDSGDDQGSFDASLGLVNTAPISTVQEVDDPITSGGDGLGGSND